MDVKLKGKRALVMGSSGGMGNGIARALAAEGVELLLTARREELLAREAAEIADTHGVHTDYVACDLTTKNDVQRLADIAIDKLGGIDIQINNCGGPPRLTPTEAQETHWRDWFEIIMMSAIKITNVVLPGMRKRGWGRILTMTSSNIMIAASENVLSTSLRMGLVGWSKSLANEVAADGVTVNCLVPGRIETDRVRNGDIARARRLSITPEELRERMIAEAPMGRDGTVAEMADVAVLLCSHQARYVTGSTIKVDGGRIPVNY